MQASNNLLVPRSLVTTIDLRHTFCTGSSRQPGHERAVPVSDSLGEHPGCCVRDPLGARRDVAELLEHCAAMTGKGAEDVRNN
jgi:hypothetical protein